MNFTSPGLWSFCIVFAWISSSPYAGIGLSVPLQSWGTEGWPTGWNLVTESSLTEDQERGRDGDLQGTTRRSILLGLPGETWVGLERWEPEDTLQCCLSFLTQRGREAPLLDLSQAQKMHVPWHPSQNAPTLLCQIKKGPAIYATEIKIFIIKVKPKIQFYWLVANY